MSTEQIMEQAQVFASAWSLVGSRFDSGDAIDSANNEEERLGQMIDELVKERDEWKARCEFSFEQRDKLTAERDALTAKVASFESRIDRHVKTELALIVNNKSLKAAARLALGALTTAHINVLDDMLADEIQQVIAALKAVLK